MGLCRARCSNKSVLGHNFMPLRLGPQFVLSNLLNGQLLDYQAHDGKTVARGWTCMPVVTTFTLLGGLSVIVQSLNACCRRTAIFVPQSLERNVWILCCFMVWTLLFCGRGEFINHIINNCIHFVFIFNINFFCNNIIFIAR